MENFIYELKKQIIEVLNLEDVTPEEIDNDAPLFGEGLGLDSIDALELIVDDEMWTLPKYRELMFIH